MAALLAGCAGQSGEQLLLAEAELAAGTPLPVRAVYEGAVRSTAVGLLHHPVTTASTGLAALKNRSRELLPVEGLLGNPSAVPVGPAPGTAAFEKYLESLDMPAPVFGTADFLVDGREFFPRLEQAIAQARGSIDWMVFIFDNDDFAVHMAQRLKARSRDVRIRVLMDRLGSVMAGYSPPATPLPDGFVAPASMASFLRDDSKVRVRKHSYPWLVTNHSKVFLFDRQTVFLGGMNIGREYRNEWHDLMVELHGPVAAHFAYDFDRHWRLADYFGDLHLLRPPRRLPPAGTSADGIPLRILRTAPWVYDIERAQLAAIRASRRQIVVITPYFTSSAMTTELQRAARRGVDVRVVLPREIDSQVMLLSNAETAARLAEAGVKIHQFPGVLHLKAAIYDGWACLGSANMDTLSLRINYEKNIAFSDPETIARFRHKVIDRDLRRSPILSQTTLQRNRATWIQPLGKQL